MIRNKELAPDNDVRIAMSEWVRRVRVRHNMTQQEFAHALGYRQQGTISVLECPSIKTRDGKTKATINLYVIQRICKVFGTHCFIHIKENGKVTVS